MLQLYFECIKNLVIKYTSSVLWICFWNTHIKEEWKCWIWWKEQVFLKGVGADYLYFSRFIILHVEIILLFAKSCYRFEEKNFLPPYFCENSHSKLSAIVPVCMCKKDWCVRLGQEGVVCMRVWENYLQYLKRGWNRKEVRGNKNLRKKEGGTSWVKWWMT